MDSYYPPTYTRVHPEIGEHSLTKQSSAQECDINHILNQYQRTGVLTHVNSSTPSFEDLPSDYDYQSAINIQLQAEAAFAALPSNIRERFANDPSLFLSAFQDDKLTEELRELGLLNPKAPEPASEPSPGPA